MTNISGNQYSKTNTMNILFKLLRTKGLYGTCFENYLFILRKRCTNDAWYIACVLCQLTATWIGVQLVEHQFHSNPGRKSEGIDLLCFLDLGTRSGEWSESRPGRFLPLGKTRYPLYRWLGGPQGQSGQVRKISPPPGFDHRTVQPVASRYTDWATGPTYRYVSSLKS
jgi:hypothetical protein